MPGFDRDYLIKVGSYKIPLKIMQYGSYEISPAQRQDYDAYRDADGKMHRNTLSHTVTSIKFTTIPLREHDFRGFMDSIVAQYTNGLERKVHLTYYEDEYANYVQGDFYMPGTITFKRLNKEYYDSMDIEFIEY